MHHITVVYMYLIMQCLLCIVPVWFLILGIHVLLQYVRNGEPANLPLPKMDVVVGAAIRRTVSRNRSGRPMEMLGYSVLKFATRISLRLLELIDRCCCSAADRRSMSSPLCRQLVMVTYIAANCFYA